MAGNFGSVLNRGAAQRMARMGRGGDRMMGHLTPGETVIPPQAMTPKLWSAFQEALDRQGMMPEQYVVGSGQNSVNPATGQPEFLAQAAGPGSAVREFERATSSNPTGTEAREGGSSANQAPLVSNFPTSPEMGGGPARAGQQGMIDLVPQENWAIDSDTGQFGAGGTADVGGILGGLGGFVLGGPAGAYTGYKFGTGEFDIPTFTPYDQYGPVSTGPDFNVGPESERDSGIVPGSPTQYTQPAIPATPEFLGLSPEMSPLQLRSAIASRAVAGQGGEFTSPEAAAFYDALIQNVLINEAGELQGLDTLLPIELQYLEQIRGIENPADTAALLAALGQ